jgi:hypothetical protein
MKGKRIFALIFAILVLAAPAMASGVGAAAPGVSYVTMPVQRGNVTQVVSSTGTCRP